MYGNLRNNVGNEWGRASNLLNWYHNIDIGKDNIDIGKDFMWESRLVDGARLGIFVMRI